jgi:tetratricopeptide (TPR) repeat protein/DNA-binding response OmpR family regulator
VLLVGANEALHAALTAALADHHVFVETTPVEAVVDAVVAAAPDLLVLVGEAARDCGSAVMQELASTPACSVVPVAILDDDTALDARLRAFRHGAVAVIPRSASVDAIATRIAQLAREIPDRKAEQLGQVGEATLHEFVEALSTELRSGILSVRGPQDSESDAVRLVLGAGRPLSGLIDDFVHQVRQHVVVAEPLRYEFDERAGGTVGFFDAEADAAASIAGDVEGLQVALADDDAARADAVAQELRSHGATVVVIDFDPSPTRFARLRQIDPTVLLVSSEAARGAGYHLVRKMREDTRLRWASLLFAKWEEVWPEKAAVPQVERLVGMLDALAEPDRMLTERGAGRGAFDARLETVGPARLLRALVRAGTTLRATVHNPRVLVSVDISDGLVVGSTGKTLGKPQQELDGAAALAALLVLSSGRVHVERVVQPAAANIMATIDVALNMADAETPAIEPSLPLPSTALASFPAARPHEERDTVVSAPPERLPQWLERGYRWVREAPTVTRLPPWLLATLAGAHLLSVVAVTLALRPQTTPDRTLTASADGAEKSLPASASAPPLSGSTKRVAADPAAASSALQENGTSEAAAGVGETSVAAPTCEQLLRDQPSRSGGAQPAAARAEVKAARRALVRGDVDDAQMSYCRAIRWDERYNAALAGLIQLLLLRRDTAAAVRWAQRAVETDPADPDLQALLGDAYGRTERQSEARAAWLAAAGKQADDADASRRLAQRYTRVARQSHKRRDLPRAERYYRRAAVLQPNSVEAAMGLARVLLEEEDTRNAILWARRALSLAPANVGARVLLGDTLAQSGDTKSAEMEWIEAQRLDPANPEVAHRIANLAAGD